MVGMRQHDADAFGRGLSNLGTALFGDPRSDALLAQAQQAQAQQQKLREEMIAQQVAQQGRQQLGNIFGQLDPNAPDFMDTRQHAVGAGLGLGMEPEMLGEVARLFTNLGGGSPEQFRQGIVDPSDFLEFMEFDAGQEAAAAQQRALLENFGPEIAALLGGGGDMSDIERRAAMLAANNPGLDFGQAHTGLVAGPEIVSDESGNIARVPHHLFPGEAETVRSPGRAFAAGLPPEQRAALGDVFTSQAGTQAAPTAQPQPTAQPGTEGDQQPAPRLTDIPDTESPATPEQALNLGPVVESQSGEFSGLYDLVPFASGVGGSLQRGSSKWLGGMFDRFSFPQAAGANADMGLFNAKIRPLMTVSNRPSRMELEWINDILVGHDWFSNPADDIGILMRLEDSLTRTRDHLNQALAGDLPQVQRNELSSARMLTEQLLNDFGERPEGPVSSQGIFFDRLGEMVSQIFGGEGPRGDIRQFREDVQGVMGAEEETGLEGLSDEELMRQIQGGR